ncbi:MAG: AAA family ATPase [Pseudomonadota bacterium]
MSPARRIALSGCSGGGKSTLLAELARRGWATVAEPGRRVVRAALADGQGATPWGDMPGFIARVLDLARADYEEAVAGPVVFDRSILDALVWHHRTRTPLAPAHAGLAETHRYAAMVWLTPPWRALFSQDAERRHGWAEAVAEFEALQHYLPQMGYAARPIPQLPLKDRADWFETALAEEGVAA